MPDATPVTMPVPEPTVAVVVLPLLQVPPPGSLNAVIAPTQTVVDPVIPPGNGLTVTVVVALHPAPSE